VLDFLAISLGAMAHRLIVRENVVLEQGNLE
jgi:hypothetical protein